MNENPYKSHVPDRPFLKEFFYPNVLLHRPPIVRHKHRDPGITPGRYDFFSLQAVKTHGLLDIHRLSSGNCTKRVIAMTIGMRGDVYCIHLFIVNERIGIVIPPRYAVALGVVCRLFSVAPHYRHQRGTAGLLKSGATFLFSDITASNNAPANLFHI